MATKKVDSTPEVSSANAKKHDNFFRAEGYLREVRLETAKAPDGSDVIRGTVTIAYDESRSTDVHFYTRRYSKNDPKNENKTYADLLNFLPGSSKAVSIASLFLTHKGQGYTFADAVKEATHVVATGELQENLFYGKDGVTLYSMLRIRGMRIYTQDHPDKFFPHNEYNVEGYVKNKFVDQDTGRVKLTVLIPTFSRSGIMSQLDFITPSSDDETPISRGRGVVKDYAELARTAVNDYYGVGDTVYLIGYVLDMKKSTISDPTPDGAGDQPSFFGMGTPITKTEFVHEIIVYGGDKNHPVMHLGDKDAITEDEAKAGLVARETSIAALKEPKAKAAPAKPAAFMGFGPSKKTPAPAPAPQKDPVLQPQEDEPTESVDAPQGVSDADVANINAMDF